MDRLENIKEGIKRLNFNGDLLDDVNWLIEQAEKLEEIREVFYSEDTNVVDGYRKIIEVFEGKESATRKVKE